MRVSIVINTYNRRQSLSETLSSLRQLRYRDYEVVVVDGPSTDGTDELLEQWQDTIKAARCPIANLAVSRNIGIAAATGEIIAFIDDDAIPDPQWMGNIVAGYDSDEVGAVGGFVYNNSGYEFQSRYIVSDRFGGSVDDIGFDPTLLYNIPGAPRYARPMGTNVTFRRSLLLELGGFDEEFAYYLDETDLCLRVVDNGYVIKYVDNAFVYHKFATSDLRVAYQGTGILRQRYQLLKNQAYFAFVHGAPAHGYPAAMERVLDYAEWHRRDVKWGIAWCAEHGYSAPEVTEDLEEVIRRGIGDGIERALSGRRVYLSGQTIAQHAAPFKTFERRLIAEDRLNLCLFTQQYPPGPVDGIGRCVHELSTALAALGHTVHVITRSETGNRVDLEDGVWVHRMTVQHHDRPFTDIPQRIWDYSRTMMDEAERIHQLDPLDVIQAPTWDCEGVAPLLDGMIPVVTSLHTPLLIAASTHAEWMTDGYWMNSEIFPLLSWERRLILFSDGLAANTQAIIGAIEQEYDVAVDRARTAVVGHGYHDRSQGRSVAPSGTEAARAMTAADRGEAELRLLFIGRLEYRKGIDVLLAALDRLLPNFPNLRVDIVGEQAAGGAPSFADRFQQNIAGAAWASQVTFHGRVDEKALDDYLEDCDIFVAPSRFESFGLIFLEAMMFGKPCVGTDIGGITEVIADGDTGLLVKPGDAEELAEALRQLIQSPTLRARLGEAGRRRFVNAFAAHDCAERCVAFYKGLRDKPALVSRVQTPSDGRIELTRHCNLGEFWVKAPLYPLLSRVCKGALHWRAWACCLIIVALTEQTPSAKSDGQKALLITDHALPNIGMHAPGWQLQVTSLTGPQRRVSARHAGGGVRLGRHTGQFDLVGCLTVIDPADEDFALIIGEIARVCRPGGTIQALVALGDDVIHDIATLAKTLDEMGLQPKRDLRSFAAAALARTAFCDESVEPCLGVTIAGVDRPLAMLELQRITAPRLARVPAQSEKTEVG
jgi:glycosyltransferase involved in cell wall biosynthesis